MPSSLRASLLALALLSSTFAVAKPKPAAPTAEHPGCFLLMDLDSGQVTRINPEKCAKRLVPASTFKVPHALIALETGVLKDEHEVRKWDGVERAVKNWNQDQTLDTAMRYSAVWFFQGTAKQIGPERMKEWLGRLHYGNQECSGDITRFWLQGPLLVSGNEQLDFLARLYRDELPVSERAREIVKRTLVQRSDTVGNRRGNIALFGPWKDGAVLSGKTGFAQLADGDVTWFIGHVEKPGHRYVFVSNVETRSRQSADRPLGLVSAIDSLKKLGVL
jgi:beta-lactamase class D